MYQEQEQPAVRIHGLRCAAVTSVLWHIVVGFGVTLAVMDWLESAQFLPYHLSGVWARFGMACGGGVVLAVALGLPERVLLPTSSLNYVVQPNDPEALYTVSTTRPTQVTCPAPMPGDHISETHSGATPRSWADLNDVPDPGSIPHSHIQTPSRYSTGSLAATYSQQRLNPQGGSLLSPGNRPMSASPHRRSTSPLMASPAITSSGSVRSVGPTSSSARLAALAAANAIDLHSLNVARVLAQGREHAAHRLQPTTSTTQLPSETTPLI